jgi:hypothetical protein
MPSIVVLNYGFEKELPIGGGAGPQTNEGDLTRVYEAFPIYYQGSPCEGKILGKIHDENIPGFPIEDVEVCANEGELCTETDSTGNYQLDGVWCGEQCVSVYKSGWFTPPCQEVEMSAGYIADVNWELICTSILDGKVTDEVTGAPIADAEVTITFDNPYIDDDDLDDPADDDITLTTTTDETGYYAFYEDADDDEEVDENEGLVPKGAWVDMVIVGNQMTVYECGFPMETWEDALGYLHCAWTTHDVSLYPEAYIQGSVVCGQTPQPNTKVRLYSCDDVFLENTYTNEDGWFQFVVDSVEYDPCTTTALCYYITVSGMTYGDFWPGPGQVMTDVYDLCP